jgi:long-subunit fatty acid transport protein
MRLTLRLGVLAICISAVAVPHALAGGIEYTGQGSQSLARGGAVTARAEDPMVLAHNPAGLVELRGSQFLFNINVALMDACVDPAGFYGWGVYEGGKPTQFKDPKTGKVEKIALGDIDTSGSTPKAVETDYYSDPYDTVCLDQTVVPVPQIAWTRRISEDWGIGFGIIFPAVQPSGRWGGRNGVIRGASGELRPAATRYMLLNSSNLGIFPTLGVGYRISEMLRVGLAVEWGVIAANNFSMANLDGGTRPNLDILAHLKAQDWFVPAFTLSVHVVPIDAVDLVAAFRFQDDIDAAGDLDLTTGVFDPSLKPNANTDLIMTSLKQAMPWKLRGGIRYAERLAPRPSGTGRDEADPASPDVIHDPLQDERWDAELDVEYQFNSRNQLQTLKYEKDQSIDNPTGGSTVIPYPASFNPITIVEKHWKDQISIRLGGTFNVVPGLFGVSAGAHYENRGVDPDFMQIDFWPLARVGLHTGVIVRAGESIDFVLAYAHIFQETLVVAPPAHKTRQDVDAERSEPGNFSTHIDKTVGVPVARDGTGQEVLEENPQGTPDGTASLNQQVNRTGPGSPPYIINAGRYRSNFDVISVGANVHF